MKKLLFIIAILYAAALTGCSGGGPSASSTSSTTPLPLASADDTFDGTSLSAARWYNTTNTGGASLSLTGLALEFASSSAAVYDLNSHFRIKGNFLAEVNFSFLNFKDTTRFDSKLLFGASNYIQIRTEIRTDGHVYAVASHYLNGVTTQDSDLDLGNSIPMAVTASFDKSGGQVAFSVNGVVLQALTDTEYVNVDPSVTFQFYNSAVAGTIGIVLNDWTINNAAFEVF